MADAVTTNTILDDTRFTIVEFTNVSDGTGEAAVKKVDITAIKKNINGNQPSGLRIAGVSYSIQGFSSVKVSWDRTAGANVAMVLGAGQMAFDYTQGDADFYKVSGLTDPSEGNADNKGSILFTTVGAGATATYQIFLRLQKNGN